MEVAYTFNPSTWEAEAGSSLRPAWSTKPVSRASRNVTQRNPVLKTKQTKNLGTIIFKLLGEGFSYYRRERAFRA